MSKVIAGCDLGTGNSCVAVIETGKPIVVANAEGSRTTPSVVSLKDGERKVGTTAKRQRIVHPKETIYNVKRFMGCKYDDCSEIINKVTYDVKDVNGLPRITVDGREYSPEEISSYIVQKMKKTAEDYLGQTVTDMVITCPAWFDNAAREATKLAGEMCGVNVLRVINEPTSAILASNLAKTEKGIKVMVADIGQGTTDFSVCDIEDGVVEVLASKGSTFLGGSDWDNAIADYLVKGFKEENGIDLSKEPQAMQRILEAAEKAKIELSSSTTTEINLPYIAVNTENTPLHLIKSLTKAKMEQLTSHLVDEVIKYGHESLKEANISANDLNCILLVGGQSRSNAIQEALTREFKVELNKSVNPDEAVALGAAIQANIIVGGEGASDILLLDVTPLTLGIETEGGVLTPIVEANTTIPCKRSQIFTTAMDNQPSVTISVLQGERPMAKDNKMVGMFNLDGIAPARRGIPQIEVTFDIDANGIVSVSAVDKATGKEQHITIEDSNSLSKDEVERIKREAEEHAAEDAKTKERLENANKAEGIILQTEKLIDDFKDKNDILTEEDKTYLNSKIDELKKMKENSNFDNLENTIKEVQTRLYAISAKAYGQQNGGTNTTGGFDPNMFANFAQNFSGGNTSTNTTTNNTNSEPDVEEV